MNWHLVFEAIGIAVSIFVVLLIVLYATGFVHIEGGKGEPPRD